MATQSAPELSLAEQLQWLIKSIASNGVSILARYDTELLQSIVDAAAQIFGATAASIGLIDETYHKIVFKVAYGAGKENVVGLSVPLDRGLAGYVVKTGQPVSVRDVKQDTRFNQEFASRTGYVPRSILAAPLLVADRTIGVMEVLDKISAPSFGVQDMALLGLFARQAAIAIHQSQQYDRLESALIDGLQRLAASAESPELSSVINTIKQEQAGGAISSISDLCSQVSQMGPDEQRACLDILSAFVKYAGVKGQ